MWLVEVNLKKTGINIELPKGHSTSSASSSRSDASRTSLTEILRRMSCSNKSTLQNIYHKDTVEEEQGFQEKVFKSNKKFRFE